MRPERRRELERQRAALVADKADAIAAFDRRIEAIDDELSRDDECELAGSRVGVQAERRARWNLTHREDTRDLVYARCGNALCVRIDHLTLTPTALPPVTPRTVAEPALVARHKGRAPHVVDRAAARETTNRQHEEFRTAALAGAPDAPLKGTVLTIKDIRVIRAIDRPFTKDDEARFGVSRQQLLNVRNRKSWQWVPE